MMKYEFESKVEKIIIGLIWVIKSSERTAYNRNGQNPFINKRNEKEFVLTHL